MSTISDFQKYLTDVEDHYNQHRAPSPVSKVNSWELKDMGGACGELNSHGYPLRIEVDCAGAPDSSSQHQDPPSPPHTNPGTPTHPVVQDLVQTMMKPPNRQRIPVWQVYSKEDFQDPRLLLPRHGSKMSKSPSSGMSPFLLTALPLRDGDSLTKTQTAPPTPHTTTPALPPPLSLVLAPASITLVTAATSSTRPASRPATPRPTSRSIVGTSRIPRAMMRAILYFRRLACRRDRVRGLRMTPMMRDG
jgi:hypothetical protein